MLRCTSFPLSRSVQITPNSHNFLPHIITATTVGIGAPKTQSYGGGLSFDEFPAGEPLVVKLECEHGTSARRMTFPDLREVRGILCEVRKELTLCCFRSSSRRFERKYMAASPLLTSKTQTDFPFSIRLLVVSPCMEHSS